MDGDDDYNNNLPLTRSRKDWSCPKAVQVSDYFQRQQTFAASSAHADSACHFNNTFSEMSLITNNIKTILNIKIKARHDSYTDQYMRIFMVKMCVVSSLVMGVDWFHDTVSCMVPSSSSLKPTFIHSACWIQGFYVYPEMAHRIAESNYYGIPKNMDFDGVLPSGGLCQTYTRQGIRNSVCRPFAKRYYLQYQWMPFYIASLSLMYYLPYVLFRIVNTDMISLKSTLTKEKVDGAEIVETYFNYDINSNMKMRIRIGLNIILKGLYIAVSIMAYLCTDSLLLGNFKNYGVEWIRWSHFNHSRAFDFFVGNEPKPGNVLLPSFGYCEIQEASMDIQHVFFNKNKFICEISPNILYQYVFVVLWFVIVSSIAISIAGLIINLAGHVITMACFLKDGSPAKKVYKKLSLRECEYLTFIRRKNIPLYGEVLGKLSKQRMKPRLEMNGNIMDHAHEPTIPLMNGGNGVHKRPSKVESSAPPDSATRWSKI
ncbi:innexin inx2-like [Clytia hemisphaerica]|uniref:Innexin n=1 Tax=Clytia hemisphaerica TaxID=252671 RepID=A0A7M5UHU8_9CNID